jgi:hypothetical protein
MMKKTVAAVTVAALCTAAAAIALARASDSPSGGVEHDTKAAQSQSPEQSQSPALYTLREYRGKVAVFTGGFDEIPAIETDIDVSGLREYDRKLLSDGIPVEAYEGVLRLLEDFA